VVAIVVVLIVAAFVLVFYRFGPNHTSSTALTQASSTSSPSQLSSHSEGTATTFVNSTYTFTCSQNATCDFYLPFTLNVTCTGCSFSGTYVSPSPSSKPTEVSGNHKASYNLASFDAPFYLAWNISKLSSAGTLEVTITGRNSALYYDRTTSAPYGFLAGQWNVAVGTENEQFG
jgi:hypothetical protein